MSVADSRPRSVPVDPGPVAQVVKTLNEYGQDDDARLVTEILNRNSGPPVIVVVGEVKRGKSTLVNALAGAVVSPTGADLPTTCTIAIVPPSPQLPAGMAQLLYATRTDTMPTADAVQGLIPNNVWDAESPLRAVFAVDSPWVPGAAIIDTPGVGGLDSAHALAALQAAAQAAALVFVSDGGQPLTAPELNCLRAASEHTDHVVLALTKIDRNPGAWEQIRDENRALLAEHAPRFASHEIYPVSAAYAIHALSQPEETAAQQIVAASGLPPLAAALREVVSDRRRLNVANALRAGHSSLARLEAKVDLQIRTIQNTEAVRDLQNDKARLGELQLKQRRSRLDLERDFGRVREAAVQFTNDRADEVLVRQTARIRKKQWWMTAAARDEFAGELEAELSMLADQVRQFTGERLSELVVATFGSVENIPEASGEVSAELHEVHTRVRTRPNAAMSPLLDPSLAGTAFMGSKMASGAMLPLASLGPPGWLVGVIGAGAMVALNVGFRGKRLSQQELQGTLYETVNGAKQDLTKGIDSWIRELRPELHIAVEDYLKQAVTEVNALLREADRAAKLSGLERRKALDELQRQRHAVQSRRNRVAERLTELGTREHSALAAAPTGVTATDGQAPDPAQGARHE